MKFQEFFEKNYKLIKLNFVLLGTFIFFMTLQFANVCYAVTDDDLSSMGLTTAEWTEQVLNYNNIGDKPYIVWKCWDSDKAATHTYVYVYPDFTIDTIPLLTVGTSRFCINFTNHFDLTTISKSDFAIQNSGDGINMLIYDYDLNGHSLVKNYVTSINYGGCDFYKGTDNEFKVDYNIRLGNYACSNWSTGYGYIQYTNFKNYMKNSSTVLEFDENKKLVLYDYDSYISYLSDDYGDYIKLDSALNETNVSTILFEGANILNNVNSYTVSALANLDNFKMYVNDSSTVKITMKDSDEKVLYTTTKHYNSVNDGELFELFDYDFDVSNSEVGEFNGVWYYKDIDFYLKYNNIYDYHNDNNYGDIVYWPVISFDVIFNNGDVISGTKSYFAFDEIYHLSLPGPLLCQDVMASGDEGGLVNLFYPIGMYNFGVDIGEMLSSGNLYSLRINMAVEKLQIDNVGNYIYLSTVHSRSIIQNFSTKQNVGIGTVVELQDNDGNDIGFVVVDGNGNIISESLNEGYTTDSKYVYDSNNNVVYTFNSSDNGWNLVDKDGVVIKDHTNVTIEDKVQYANDNSFAGNFADTIGTIASTITGSLSALLTSVSGVASLFASAFSWLPDPIPQLVLFIFSAMVIFALIRFIRGH